MPTEVQLVSATPVLASLDIEKSVAFYCDKLGFIRIYAKPSVYGIVQRNQIALHFWACQDPVIAKATSCRIGVKGIEALYQSCSDLGIVHPSAPLAEKPWGAKEFGVLDPDGNLVIFHQ